MESVELKKLLCGFLELPVKPETKEPLVKLYLDLQKISKDEIGKDEEKRYKVIRLIQTFGLTDTNLETVSHEDLTVKQWRRLREYISKLSKVQPSYPSAPIRRLTSAPLIGKKYQINIPELNEEITSVVLDLVSSLSSNVLSSAITVPVLNYFELISVLTEGRPELRKKLEPIDRVLEGHGWTSGGFIAPPDRLAILKDLENLLTQGLDVYREFHMELARILPPKEREKKEEKTSDLVSSIVETLIESIQSLDFVEAESCLETLTDLIQTEEDVPTALREAIERHRADPDWIGLLHVLMKMV